jgi:hypothetical protein
MIEVVGGLPVIEDLIAVLDWRVEGSYEAGEEDYVESYYGLESAWLVGLVRTRICSGDA